MIKLNPYLTSAFRFIFFISILVIQGCAGTPSTHLGQITQDGLQPCPSSPNCVSSFSQDEQHYITPFSINDKSKRTFECLKILLSQNPNVTITTNRSDYIHAEFHSQFWGFVDDVEFLLKDNQIHVRSASRVGYSDFGVNRKRINQLWQALSAHL